MRNDLIFGGEKKEPKPKWCKKCGRKHPARKSCDLVKVENSETAGGRHHRVRVNEDS